MNNNFYNYNFSNVILEDPVFDDTKHVYRSAILYDDQGVTFTTQKLRLVDYYIKNDNVELQLEFLSDSSDFYNFLMLFEKHIINEIINEG